MRKLIVGMVPVALTAMSLLCATSQLHAQGGGGGRTTGGGGGGSLGTSGGGGGGGGSASSGGTYGGATGTSSGRGGTTGGSANVQYGTGAPTGPYFNNPYAFGLSGNSEPTSNGIISGNSATSANSRSGGGSSGSGSSIGSSSSSMTTSNSGFSNVAAAATAKFGQPVYSVNPVSTFTQPTSTGTASIKTSNSTNTQTPQTAVRPAYAAYIGFKPEPVPVGLVTGDVQRAILASPDLSKPGNNVQLVLNGDVVVLRGSVQEKHDSDLAETLASMTPGVRGVRNELAIRELPSLGLPSR